ncbi:MAG: hypothetical protein ABI776_14440, partial [Nocardioidaceae bacterium]
AQSSDLLMPFEDQGVDSTWELRMPRAANAFEYSTIADVLISMDYSALDSIDYREQVVQRLPQTMQAERPFSFTTDFADAWYDLHNPALLLDEQQMRVKVRTLRADFPPNLDRLAIDNVLLYFARADGFTAEVPVTGLRFTEDGTAAPVGGGSITLDGAMSTRRSNGGAWTPMIGRSPLGEWELELPRTAQVKGWFIDRRITEILLVVSYSGRLPAWPR